MDEIEKELFSELKERDGVAYEMAKDLSRGIFWVLAESENDITKEKIFPIQKYCDFDGNSDDYSGFSSADGTTYNHKETWKTLPKEITKGKPFDYYPRGRVEISNGSATIWMNGNILELADEIKSLYGLSQLKNVRVREDGSSHYKCHLDSDYKPSK